ncbi:metallophosphoesterase [Stutzerimonas stutzeri]|uniref:STAND family AAA ATPase n=4 Tax=Stutzerimonas stutzeri TaxID=316 RepID=UPI001EF69DDD|nr:metallophosphoesterase [Stutzerimonas stutzeri]CAB5527823.1 Calcineurin-like phosphoesterase [Stutzerimonas stutzeri]CAB5548907.1 Calcineurin-like phosphoesterase [Stutzerimonas stutzeri]CAC9097239.1 Calcineurin-like phosphoesterase [Stutzerimonas stutzeri]
MSAILLHLSDIHIRSDKDKILQYSNAISATLNKYLDKSSTLFIIVSGDIAFSGKKSQYSAAEKFLNEIKRNIYDEYAIEIEFIIAPGNHDCDFELNNSARKMLIASIEGTENPEIDHSVVQSCTSVQAEFIAFKNRLENTPHTDPLWQTRNFTVDGKKICFDTLNLSWMSKIREEPGKLYFPTSLYESKTSEKNDVRIIALHHPFNWLNQNTYRDFRSFIRRIGDIVITGHEHVGNVGLNSDSESELSVFVEGCALQGHSQKFESAFNVIVMDLAQQQFSSTRYELIGEAYIAVEEGSWSDYRNLPTKETNEFAINSSFFEVLEDPGAFFKHPSTRNITLSDIYVYPDLKKINDNTAARRSLINSSKLISPEFADGGILIEGEEKSGTTSLLFQIYKEYHARGYIPLLIKGKYLKKNLDTEIRATIRKAIVEQYGRELIEKIEQTPPSKKILLIDAFDDSPLRAAEARASLLCNLRQKAQHLVVGVSDMFEMGEILSSDQSQTLSLDHYKLQPFGYSLRSKLIEKWFSLGNDGSIDESTFISRCDEAERLMNSAMTKTVTPSLPLYLLTLLQSIESGQSGDFKESALGYYYQYLLTESLQSNGVRKDKLTEHFQYIGHLAWEFHSRGAKEVSESDLLTFNTKFSATWHTVNFTERLETLVSARVLTRNGEDYSFRYPYIYYFLKGQYLSEHLQDIEIRDYIKNCCKHLYVRDHANTILFLAHHTNDEFVLDQVSASLRGLFGAWSPLKLNGDTAGINKLIDDAPKMRYSGVAPKEHRAKQNLIKDQLENDHDGLADSEETSPELSLFAEMTMLFKNIEILGQVLKNQYSKIQRARKYQLIEELFNAPLRALKDFYTFFETNPDSLAKEIEAALQKKGSITDPEERKTVARKIAASLIQVITFGFVMRAAQGANTDSLAEEVSNVVKSNDSLAFRMIELGIKLDSYRELPRSLLRDLYHETKRDITAARLLQMMVLHRLYMFKTSEKDMQWLTTELQIDIETQHMINYQDKNKRLV